MNELIKPLTIESFAEYDKMDPVKRKAIEAQLFQSSQVKKYREKKIKKIMNRYEKRKLIKMLAQANKIVEKGVNKLYWWRVQQKNTTKIGDTHRGVEERNNETGINAALLTTERLWWEAKYSDTHPNKKLRGKSFRDYDFHKVLKQKGYVRELNDKGNESEWFMDITLEDFLILLEEFIGGKPKKTLELRAGQGYVIDEIVEGWDEGYDFTNVHASVRIGKNIATLTASKRKSYVPIYIGKNLTSQSSVVLDNEDFQIVDDMETFSIHGMKSDSPKVQKIIDEIISLSIDKKVALFIDESDDQSHTLISMKILEKIYDTLKGLGYAVKVTTLSGTRPERGEKILNFIKGDDDKIKNVSISYNEMQILQPETTVKRNIVSITVYSDTDVELSNISDSMKSAKGREDLLKTIAMLVGENDYDLKDTSEFPHWFIKFATVGKENVRKLVSMGNKKYSTIDGKEVHFHAVNGDFTSNREAQEYCKGIENKHSNKLVVFITQGMATTSFSRTPIANTAVFTDNELTADDIQSLHRGATFGEGKEWTNMVIVTTNDSKELKFHDVFGEELIGLSKKEKNIVMKEILSLNGITYVLQNGYDCSSHSPLKLTKDMVEQVLIQKEKQLITRSSLTSLLMNDESIDFEELEKISNGKGLKTSKKSKTKKGKTNYPFGNPNTNNEPTNKMTMAKKQRIARAIVEKLINVSSISKMMNKDITDFDDWNLLGLPEDIFFRLYDNNLDLKERLDDIHIACSDKKYMVEEHLKKLTV